MTWKNICILAFFVLLFSSCDEGFEYSVYSEHVDDNKKNTTEKNIKELKKKNSDTFSDFSIYFLSDTHIYYKELRKAVKKINSLKNNADFVVHCGDISNEGLFKEYEFTWNLMNDLHLPYLTVIGNHDLVANGRAVYKSMFGKENYTFTYKNCKFVFFDDNVWENTVMEPDFQWLKQELCDDTQEYTHVFLIAHVPYWDDMFYNSFKIVFKSILEESKVNLCIHGHAHRPTTRTETLDNGKDVRFLVTGSIRERMVRRIDIKQDTVIINDVKF